MTQTCRRNATEQNPSHIKAWHNELLLLEEQQSHEECISRATLALEKNGYFLFDSSQHKSLCAAHAYELHSALGTCLAQRGRFAEAETALQRALKLQQHADANVRTKLRSFIVQIPMFDRREAVF